MSSEKFTALKWFKFAIGVGLVLNLIFALPALFAPRVAEGLLDVGVTNTPFWLQDVGILLLIVSAAYLPVIRDPFRYLFVTYLVVAGRFAAGILWLLGVLYMDYPAGTEVFVACDLGLSIIQAVLLYFALRAGDPHSRQLSPSQI